MKREFIQTILNTDLAKEEIENIKLSYEITDEEIADYIIKTSLFFEKINVKGISNLNIINVFISAIQKCQEEIYDTNRKGQLYTKRKPSFYDALKECYVKYIVGYIDQVDFMLAEEEPIEERQEDDGVRGI